MAIHVENAPIEETWELTPDSTLWPDTLRHSSLRALYGQGDFSLLRKPLLTPLASNPQSPYARSVAEVVGRVAAEAHLTLLVRTDSAVSLDAAEAALAAGGSIVLATPEGPSPIRPVHRKPLLEAARASHCVVSTEPARPKDTQAYLDAQAATDALQASLATSAILIQGEVGDPATFAARRIWAKSGLVLAVPGSIFAAAASGPNRLIKEGVAPVISEKDLKETLTPSLKPRVTDA